MKNLFNDISQEEKNRILEMHSGKKNVISEQEKPEHGMGLLIKPNNYEEVLRILIKKYGESGLCGSNQFNKVWPYDEDVKKFQIALNKLYKEKKVAEDGILGPDTKSWICYKGA